MAAWKKRKGTAHLPSEESLFHYPSRRSAAGNMRRRRMGVGGGFLVEKERGVLTNLLWEKPFAKKGKKPSRYRGRKDRDQRSALRELN